MIEGPKEIAVSILRNLQNGEYLHPDMVMENIVRNMMDQADLKEKNILYATSDRDIIIKDKGYLLALVDTLNYIKQSMETSKKPERRKKE